MMAHDRPLRDLYEVRQHLHTEARRHQKRFHPIWIVHFRHFRQQN
jgi:hypothetical protein